MPTNQRIRDFATLALLVLAVSLFLQGVTSYLVDLDRPMLLIVGFLLTFALGIYYELRHRFDRSSWVSAAAIGLVFALAVQVAHYLRDSYIGMIADLDRLPEFHSFAGQFIGRDLYAALTNRTIGYGSCFAVSVMLIRLTLHRPVRAKLEQMLVLPEYMPAVCQCCNQVLPVENLPQTRKDAL